MKKREKSPSETVNKITYAYKTVLVFQYVGKILTNKLYLYIKRTRKVTE